MQLTPEQIQKVQAKNIENLVKKAAEGKTLTARELEMLNQQAELAEIARPEFVKTKASLAALFNFTKQRLQKLSKKEGFPKVTPQGFNVQEVTDYLLAEGIDIHQASKGTLAAEKNGETKSLTELKAELLQEQIRRLKFQNEVERRQYISTDEIAMEITRIISQFKSVIYSKMESELPPILEGMTAADIQVKMRDGIADAFGVLESDKWKKTFAKQSPAAQ